MNKNIPFPNGISFLKKNPLEDYIGSSQLTLLPCSVFVSLNDSSDGIFLSKIRKCSFSTSTGINPCSRMV